MCKATGQGSIMQNAPTLTTPHTQKHLTLGFSYFFRFKCESLEFGKVKKILCFPGSGRFQAAEASLLLSSAELKGFNLSLSFIVFVWLIIPPTICLRRRIKADSAKWPEFSLEIQECKSLNSRGFYFSMKTDISGRPAVVSVCGCMHA